MSTTTEKYDYSGVTKAQQAAWETGAYARVGNTLQIIAERLVESVDVRPDQKVVDVAAGQGNAALAAARRFAEAVAVDYARNLLAEGRERAQAERLPVRFVEGDAQDLPCEDGEQDVALSVVGTMFAPDHAQTASELVRVVKPGGRIGLASWTPTSLVADMFRIIGSYAPKPPVPVQPPVLWGDADHLRDIFGDRVEWISLQEKEFHFCYRSPEHFADWFVAHYGPITRLSGSLDEVTRARFATELAGAARTHVTGDGPGVKIVGTYLEAVGVRK
ncbi:class I SAM-dependent methyltransferase [Spongisporangium articulatum]|uniref:Class I SAM-dependent methyltransferase n=1 Tax=Spongisporangium articulatum TaxID=3362603 RepID=A0ABW8ANZ5_9ACTN